MTMSSICRVSCESKYGVLSASTTVHTSRSGNNRSVPDGRVMKWRAAARAYHTATS